MRRQTIYGFAGFAVLIAAAGYIDDRRFDAGRQTLMSAADPQSVTLKPAPIRPEWIIAGQPVTQAAEIAHSDDGAMQAYVWRTSASRFHWNYDFDEVVTIIDGDVFISDADGGQERHLKAGDVAFFPDGARTIWRVPDHLRKIAVVKKKLPGPMASAWRWLRALRQMVRPSAAFAG